MFCVCLISENGIGRDLASSVKSVWMDDWMIKSGLASECRIWLIGRDDRVRGVVRSHILLERDNRMCLVVGGMPSDGGDLAKAFGDIAIAGLKRINLLIDHVIQRR